MSDRRDILIIGGGIIGLAIALELKLRGASVTVLTRDRQQAATRAAGGMLAPHAEQLSNGPLRDFGLKSLLLYPEWIRTIEHLSNAPTGYWPSGILAPVCAADLPQQTHHPHENLDHPSSLRTTHWLDRSAIHHMQPGLSSSVTGGWWYPDDGQVDNRALFNALWRAAETAGVTIQESVTVQAIQHHQSRVTDVRTTVGTYHADHYVLATGAWSPELLPVPVAPLKGQMIAVQEPSSGDTSAHLSLPLRRVLFGEHCYIIPRLDGRILIGATVESVGFTPNNTLAGLQSLLNAALKLYPELNDYPVIEQWWGYRPTTPDKQPLLGPTYCDNLTIASGHHRNGILLAPATALLISDWIINQASNEWLIAFSGERFGCWASPSPTVGAGSRSPSHISTPQPEPSQPESSQPELEAESLIAAPSSSPDNHNLTSTSIMPTLYSSPTPSPSSETSTADASRFDASDPSGASTHDLLTIAGRTFQSRLMTGTGKYRNFDEMQQAIAASGCQIVTVAVRRVQTQAPGHEGLAEALDWTKLWMLPNTAGCKTAEEAIRVARLGREMAKLLGQEDNNFVKLEVIPDTTYLLPDPIGTLEAAEQLVKEGFAVLPYINADPILAKRLEEVGCATVMPLGSPIGSGQGIRNAANIQIIVENATVPVVVDAGIGTPSEAAQAMELGADALLINTAIAQATHPGRMGRAMKLATEAGRIAYSAGRIPIRQSASASSPLTGTISS
jgi:thiazole synthase